MDLNRVEFAKKSLEKGKSVSEDPFLYFMILWLGLNSLYAYYDKNNEIDKIQELFKEFNSEVSAVLVKNKHNVLQLRDYISHSTHSELARYLSTRQGFLNNQTDESIMQFAQILNKIRNNMFHAAKLWNDREEAELLSKINPILNDLVTSIIDS